VKYLVDGYVHRRSSTLADRRSARLVVGRAHPLKKPALPLDWSVFEGLDADNSDDLHSAATEH